MDIVKRKALKNLSVVGAACTLPSCAILEYLFTNNHLTNIDCTDGTYPVVDAHAHFFNGTDLLAGPYLTGPVVNDLFRYANRQPIKTILTITGKVVQRIATSFSITAESELSFLEQKSIAHEFITGTQLFNYQELEYKQTSEAFYDVLTDDERNQIQLAIRQLEADRDEKLKANNNKGLADAFQPIIFGRNTLFEAITDGTENVTGTDKENIWALYAVYKILGLDTLFTFVLRMLSKRSSNLAEYQSVYSSKGSEQFVINTTDISVDFDYWLKGCDTDYASNIKAQVAVHERLHQLSGGYTIPILGVNPMKLLDKGQQYKDFIEQTLSNNIYRGIKIYPTLGFSPNGELHKDFKDDMRTCGYSGFPSEEQIRNSLYDLYTICLSKGAVVMAHSDKSKGNPKSAAELAGPMYWKKVFQNKSLKNLKVNFGHLGEFKSSDDSNWTSEFLKLMVSGNRYGDLGFWFTQGSKGQLERLIKEAKRIGGEDIFSRVLYGSDWYMLTSKPNWKPYLNRAHKYFSELVDDGAFDSSESGIIAMNKFFYLNAKQLYGESVKTCA